MWPLLSAIYPLITGKNPQEAAANYTILGNVILQRLPRASKKFFFIKPTDDSFLSKFYILCTVAVLAEKATRDRGVVFSLAATIGE